MGKRSSRRASATTPRRSDSTVPVVGAREPCPCGSGRRYKACHGRESVAAAEAYVPRPFEGLPGECDWVAMREIVPAATATLRLADGRTATAATVLPLAWPALVRSDGSVIVGLQVPSGSGDTSRDIARALEEALATEAPGPVAPRGLPGPGSRLQDVLDLSAPLEVQVHDGFDFWLEEEELRSPEVSASMERANEAVVPTVRLSGVEAAYWCDIRGRNHVRWVVPYDEDSLIDGLARLHARGEDGLGEGSRYIGSFRAHGLAVPVWDLAEGTTAEAAETPLQELASRLDEAMADSTPLTADERRARSGLSSRQLTLR